MDVVSFARKFFLGYDIQVFRMRMAYVWIVEWGAVMDHPFNS